MPETNLSSLVLMDGTEEVNRVARIPVVLVSIKRSMGYHRARSAGLSAAWVQRSKEKIYDPWGIESNVTVRSLFDLPAALEDGR